ncbi:hypothetical protein BY458DRAFT_560742 [Sporodiniella umbellata]|nr:hypothetical protein BY458DRAFT_560742 [Sporodiniella umbellata]
MNPMNKTDYDSKLNKHSLLQVGSLNCRSLTKPQQPQVSSTFVRYLRSLSHDILTLQETHAKDMETQRLLDLKFQSSTSIWSQHCATYSLYRSHLNHIFEPFTLITIYAPASANERRRFYHSILQLSIFSTLRNIHEDKFSIDNNDSEFNREHRLIITGDFNYTPSDRPQITSFNITSTMAKSYGTY